MSPLLGWRLRELRLPTWAVFHELEPEQKGYLLASLAASPGEARGSRLEDQESRYPGIREGYLQGRWHLAHQAFLEAGFGDLEAWSEVMKARLAKPITDQQFLKAFHDTAMKDPILVPLLIRLQHVIEHNVSIPLLIDSKRHFQNCLGTIAERAVSALNLVESQANELIWSLGVLLSGAAQSDQGPSLCEEDLPEDVATLMGSLSSERLFLTNGRYILEGIRRDN